MILAQFSDPHVGAPGTRFKERVDTNGLLRQAVGKVLAMTPCPHQVWITGDLVIEGAPEEYAALREILSPLPMPVYLLPGNHDDRAALRAAFPDHAYLPREGAFLHYVVETERARLIGLDTQLPGEVAGELCTARLAWLEARLEEAPERPTMIFMHHPPFTVGMPMDRHLCRNGSALEALLRKYPNIHRIACGHLHRMIQLNWGGTTACVCPSTAFQISADFAGGAHATFGLEPPGFLVHLWPTEKPPADPRGPITHFIPSGTFEGPFSFGD